MPVTELEFREYRKGDLDAMYGLDVVCFEPVFRFSRRAMQRFAEDPHALTVMAERNGELAGFAIAEAAEGAAYVVTVDVAPEWRGHGLGLRLMQELERKAVAGGARLMVLHVFEGNAGAVRLYERLGYERTGLARGFYGPGLHALVYEKQLGE